MVAAAPSQELGKPLKSPRKERGVAGQRGEGGGQGKEGQGQEVALGVVVATQDTSGACISQAPPDHLP